MLRLMNSISPNDTEGDLLTQYYRALFQFVNDRVFPLQDMKHGHYCGISLANSSGFDSFKAKQVAASVLKLIP